MNRNLTIVLVFASFFVNAQSSTCSPTFSEIFDFNVGDKFHYSLIDRSDDVDGTTLKYSKETVTILKKIVSGDMITYYREIVNTTTTIDTLVLIDDGMQNLHACDSDLVKVNEFLYPKFHSPAFDTTEIYAYLNIYKNDTVRYWRNEYPHVVKAIRGQGNGSGYFTKIDSNTYKPFDNICEILVLEYVAGAGLLYEEHFCFESGFYKLLLKKTNGNDTTIYETASIYNKDLQQLNFSIFPNPIKDKLTIKFEKSSASKYAVVNSIGQTVANGVSSSLEHTIDLSSLPAGVYFLNTSTQDASGTVRFIKD